MSKDIRAIGTKLRRGGALKLHALADYANMGDTPEHWKTFRERWPAFFPDYLNDWLYADAEEWFRRVSQGEPSEREFLANVRPPLLFYRWLLRIVWERKDPTGGALKMLLGFEQSAAEAHFSFSVIACVPPPSREPEWRPRQEPGPASLERVAGMPAGKPVVNGVDGTITWQFGCDFQRAVYNLMQDRWRAMICAQCKQFFVATKTAQSYCSPLCYKLRKQEQALDYYYRKGRNQKKKRVTRRGRAKGTRARNLRTGNATSKSKGR